MVVSGLWISPLSGIGACIETLAYEAFLQALVPDMTGDSLVGTLTSGLPRPLSLSELKVHHRHHHWIADTVTQIVRNAPEACRALVVTWQPQKAG
jgi:hypothetical protein